MPTHVNFLLDETSSMMPNRAAIISTFNEYLKQLQGDGNEYRFWLTLFNSEKKEHRHDGIPVSDVPALDDETYRPNGMTPLYDAVMASLRRIEGLAGNQPVITVVFTDGEENASIEATLAGVKALIELKEKLSPPWKFIYLGAHPKAWEEGFKVGGHVNTQFDMSQVKPMMVNTASATRMYASTQGNATDAELASNYASTDVKWKGKKKQ